MGPNNQDKHACMLIAHCAPPSSSVVVQIARNSPLLALAPKPAQQAAHAPLLLLLFLHVFLRVVAKAHARTSASLLIHSPPLSTSSNYWRRVARRRRRRLALVGLVQAQTQALRPAGAVARTGRRGLSLARRGPGVEGRLGLGARRRRLRRVDRIRLVARLARRVVVRVGGVVVVLAVARPACRRVLARELVVLDGGEDEVVVIQQDLRGAGRAIANVDAAAVALGVAPAMRAPHEGRARAVRPRPRLRIRRGR
ncbi:uncharacterized protein K452DRAFT_115039 [Aplosporella prunicola CBS 121167]|uniref:Uncharacterized protein n=1 Tax=Aplosporella prunicola CBS 121167 TaxID=1176127 RepID=A0A6A6B181_9PEZI|nr:uncharacterized protein K452DRAFT_115039 [Aplosporella prunicola CBS 121167]KAF2137015.1 hypothetical protein K452DRAFT_115039 [Aplosporella prunicola CBS 121167]